METAVVDVAILCGGLGKRLQPVSGDTQKTMVRIGEKPFLEILYRYVAGFGFENFVFCTGYKGRTIEEHFAGFKNKISFSQELEPLGTGGALKNAERMLRHDTLLVLNGDSFCPVDLNALLEAHERFGGEATLTVASSKSRNDGGYIRLSGDSRVLAFQEKQYDPSLFINAGVYVFSKRILRRIPAGRFFSLEKDLLSFLTKNESYAYQTAEEVYDIGTPERLEMFKNVCKTSRPEFMTNGE